MINFAKFVQKTTKKRAVSPAGQSFFGIFFKCVFNLTFSPNNLVCSHTKNSTFLPKKVIFSSKCGCISSTILTFLPNNLVCFYTKNSQKVNFSSNCAYNTWNFIDFSSKKNWFFPQKNVLKKKQNIPKNDCPPWDTSVFLYTSVFFF